MNQPLAFIPTLVSHCAASLGGETILRHKNRGIWKPITWLHLEQRVRQIGSALLASGFGRGDVAAILSETRPDVVYADLAILGSGAASTAIDPDADTDRVLHILSSSGARIVFVENEEQLDKVLAVRDRCPALSRIVLFDMKGLRDFADPGCISLDDFVAVGDAGDWNAAVQAIKADQPAVIQFPRDTSASGRILTHGDIIHMASTARDRLSIKPADERLVVLRLSDITERVWGLYLALETRCISNYPEGPDTVLENLRELKPTILGADAAVWEYLHGLATQKAKAATATQRIAYHWALKVRRRGGPLGQVADLLVLRAVRRDYGLGRLRLAYVGGVSPGAATQDWARGLGITIRRVEDSAAGAGQMDERYQALMQNAYA